MGRFFDAEWLLFSANAASATIEDGPLVSRFRDEVSQLGTDPTEQQLVAAGQTIFGRRSRFRRIKNKRPYGAGIKADIVQRAIRMAYEKWGVTISARYVKTCVDEHRDLVRSIRAARPSRF